MSARKSLLKNDDAKPYGMRLGRLEAADRNLVMAGASTFKTLRASCHRPDGRGLAVGGSSVYPWPGK